MKRRALAILVLVCSPGVALAQDNAAGIESAALFQDGRVLLDKGDVAGACELFARSQRRLAAIGTLLNLGPCYERLGRVASAWAAYREAASLALARRDDRASIAKAEAAKLEPRLPKLTIVIDAKAAPMTVTRNNELVDAAVLNHATPVDPGPQHIKASAPDHEPWEASVVLAEGAQETVNVPALKPTPRPVPVAPPPRERSSSWVPYVLEIGGGAIASGGLVFGGLSFGKWSDVEGRCPNGTCRDDSVRRAASNDADSAKTFATISTIGVISGLALVAIGVVYHLVDTRVTSAAAHSIRTP